MSTNPQNQVEALPPHAQLIQMVTAYWVSRVVYAAAKLGLADQLATGPKSAAELAGPTRTHAPSLHRLMRTLASLGILTEREAQRFALTPLGEALRTGAPGSARAQGRKVPAERPMSGSEKRAGGSIAHALEGASGRRRGPAGGRRT